METDIIEAPTAEAEQQPEFRSGPPPSPGWWPTSTRPDPKPSQIHLRWHNGRRWSMAAGVNFSAADAARCARDLCVYSDDVLWTDRPAAWPARSKT